MTYVIDYYNSSVKKEIDGWPKGINACFLRITKQMERSGPNRDYPILDLSVTVCLKSGQKALKVLGEHFFALLLAVRLSFYRDL